MTVGGIGRTGCTAPCTLAAGKATVALGTTAPAGRILVHDDTTVYGFGLSDGDVSRHSQESNGTAIDREGLVLAYDFSDGKAIDPSGQGNDGEVEHAAAVAGKIGRALRFVGGAATAAGFRVTYDWTVDLPMYVRAMVLADKTIFIAGPEDLIDEEQVVRRINTLSMQTKLAQQLNAWTGQSWRKLMGYFRTPPEKASEWLHEFCGD